MSGIGRRAPSRQQGWRKSGIANGFLPVPVSGTPIVYNLPKAVPSQSRSRRLVVLRGARASTSP